ncbi:MAG: hypothetical protein ACJA1L_003051 [Paracoccaceae bacterium]|jgi:uncharacterized protein YgiB involved in biofilm formation
MKRTLRSRSVRLSLIGGAAFALAACEEQQDLSFFETAAQCESAARMTDKLSIEQCDAAFAVARQEHAVAAPRYDELALCEQEHGAGMCAKPEVAGGAPDQTVNSGGVFMPMMMGYMIGNALSRGTGAAARPLYRTATGGMATSDGGTKLGAMRPGATASAPASAFRTPAATGIAKPMSRAAVASRGGFGAARSSSFGGARSSFGG